MRLISVIGRSPHFAINSRRIAASTAEAVRSLAGCQRVSNHVYVCDI